LQKLRWVYATSEFRRRMERGVLSPANYGSGEPHKLPSRVQGRSLQKMGFGAF